MFVFVCMTFGLSLTDFFFDLLVPESLLSVNFDLNPLGVKVDQQVRVRLEPIQIAYDAVSGAHSLIF